MAQYTNVNDLYADILKYVDTKEQSFQDFVPKWIYEVETELDRRLRHPAAEVISTYTVKKGWNTIPAPKELLELKSIRSRKTNKVLYRHSMETLYDVPNYDTSAIAFASLANYFYLDKVNDKEDITYEFVFYTSPVKLSPDIVTNFYLEVLPDFLLYIGLEHAFIYNGQPEQAAYWRQMGERQLALLNEQIDRETYQGSTLIAWSDTTRNDYYY